MSLTLVQLAQAIEDGKDFEVAAVGTWHEGTDMEDLSVRDIREMLDSGFIRIKPQPHEYWFVDNIPKRYFTLEQAVTARSEQIGSSLAIYHSVEVIV